MKELLKYASAVVLASSISICVMYIMGPRITSQNTTVDTQTANINIHDKQELVEILTANTKAIICLSKDIKKMESQIESITERVVNIENEYINSEQSGEGR